MGVISMLIWFINQLITGGHHLVHFMNYEYYSYISYIYQKLLNSPSFNQIARSYRSGGATVSFSFFFPEETWHRF